MSQFSGSTGLTSAWRIDKLIDFFVGLPTSGQTSAKFATLWSSRASDWAEAEFWYQIPSDEDNSAAGWSSYIYRLHGSTRNTSSGGVYGIRGLPDQVFQDFEADLATLKAESTHTDGTTDADHGRRVYEFLVSVAIVSSKYRPGGQYKEILTAWAAAGTSATPSS